MKVSAKNLFIYVAFIAVSGYLYVDYILSDKYVDKEDVIGCYTTNDLELVIMYNAIVVGREEIGYSIDNDNFGTAIRPSKRIIFHQGGLIVDQATPLAIRVHSGNRITLGIWNPLTASEKDFAKTDCRKRAPRFD